MEYSVIDYIIHSDTDINQIVEFSEEHQKLERKIERVCTALRETLTEEQKEQLDKLEELETQARCISGEKYFKAGMKLGVRLVAESMFD